MQLDQFSGQSFEQLIQALCAHVFGAGLTIFGPGRDGGREATFRGKLPTFESKGWDGYTVIQAKCKESPYNDTRDASWLCGQLRADLQKFVNNDDLEKPEYYLLCSNVQLSAVPIVGGKQQVENVFEEFKGVLKLKGWHIWSADELRALLADSPNVRQTFASWITPGDILFELMEQLVGADLVHSLPLILSQELRIDRDARLRDAGQETDQAVYLEKVFIDLPVDLPIEFGLSDMLEWEEDNYIQDGEMVEPEPYEFLEDDDELVHDVTIDENEDNCVASLFQLAADRLDPKSVDDTKKSKRWALRNRVVILGGPGQGKSTLGQFVVQLARARLLAASDRLSLNPDIRIAITKICEAATNLGIQLQGPARLPFRVDLPMLADAINQGSEAGYSVLSFIASRCKVASAQTVTVPAMRKLLKEFPWIVIFDGLDEVPPSANRREVVRAIEAFWDDVYAVGGDVLAVVTSRPQGYDNDLSPKLWQHWNLLPLSPKYAAEYANKLGDIKVSEPERKDKILQDINNACSDPSTALLTTSPLQVTILFGISFLKGSIPQDRWELFDRYYSLLREREAQKPGETAKFIRDHKRIIDDLHQTCGWILQAEAEAPGRTVSYLTDEQFKNIILRLLYHEGHEGPAAAELAERLATIATDRLVLLASRVEGQVSFDVRSLQEYMAAAKLVGSDQRLLVARLRKIAASAHWRHVFRIAASKIFSITEMGHLRDDVVAICDALDKGDLDESGEFVGAGAILALDLLADGISANAPKFFRRLLARAIAVLDMDREGYDPRICAIAEFDKDAFFFEQIETRINAGSSNARRNSVAALLALQHTEQGKKILSNFFEMQPALVLDMLTTVDPASLSKRQRERLRFLQKEAGEIAASTFALSISVNEKDAGQTAGGWLCAPELTRTFFQSNTSAIVVGVATNRVTRFSSLDSISKLYNAVDGATDSSKWPVVTASKLFLDDPGPATLAAAINIIGKINFESIARVRYEVPWPLRALINELREGKHCSSLAEAAASGKFGDKVTWTNAEARWRENPVAASEYYSWNNGFYLSPQLSKVGPPPIHTVVPGSRNAPSTLEMIQIAASLQDEQKRERLLWLSTAFLPRDPSKLSGEHVKLILETFFTSSPELTPLSVRRSRIFRLGAVWSDPRVPLLAHRYGLNGKRISAQFQDVVNAFNENPSLRGLLAHTRTGLRPHQMLFRPTIDNSAMEAQDGDPPAVRAGIVLLRLRYDRFENLDLERAASDLAQNEFSAIEAASILKSMKEPDNVLRQQLAFQLAKQLRLRGLELRGSMLDLLRANVSAAPTGLTQIHACEQLELPRLSPC